MIRVRPAHERGYANHGWLNTHFTFSFADFYDPDQMGFRALRVINEDRIAPGTGFPTHAHGDMEILTYMVSGELKHEDSAGHGAILRAGDVQRMTAGTGIAHSETNPSDTHDAHLLQIWIEPATFGLEPSYEDATVRAAETPGTWRLIAAPAGREAAATIHQDVFVSAGTFEPGDALTYTLADNRHAWVQVVRGKLSLNGVELQDGDGAAISYETSLELAAHEAAEVLLFDLA